MTSLESNSLNNIFQIHLSYIHLHNQFSLSILFSNFSFKPLEYIKCSTFGLKQIYPYHYAKFNYKWNEIPTTSYWSYFKRSTYIRVHLLWQAEYLKFQPKPVISRRQITTLDSPVCLFVCGIELDSTLNHRIRTSLQVGMRIVHSYLFYQ